MDNSFESDLGSFDEELLKYVGITNLDFTSPLSNDSVEELKSLVLSINTLVHITFRDRVRVDDIELVKHILELSPMVDDSNIEKMILLKDRDITKKAADLNYKNPNSWNVAYDYKRGSYLVATVPDYRIMEEYIGIIVSSIGNDLSQLEKIKEVYDFVKLLDLDDSSSDRLPEIVKTRKASSFGFNLLFKEILSRLGISVYIGKIQRDNEEYISVIQINDSKYGINGVYVFDPCSDSLPKSLYKNEAMRKVNYNYFCLTLNDIFCTKDKNEKLLGVLSLLVHENLSFSIRNLRQLDEEELRQTFDMSFSDLYLLVKESKRIKDDVILKIIFNTLHREDFVTVNRNIDELLRSNYFIRKEEVFKLPDDSIKLINLHDI